MADLPNNDLTSGEAQFLDQYTRSLMVQWCHHQLTTGNPPGDRVFGDTKVYFDYAKTKGWISKKDGSVLSAGWKVGAAFLKR